MKATLAGLALSTTVFAAHAAPPIVDKDSQTLTWAVTSKLISGYEATTLETLNCRFGTLSTRTTQTNGTGIAVVDLAAGNTARAGTARKTCMENGLTPGF